MSKAFGRCFDILLGHEGGVVDHPGDPGGRTKFGISQRAYPRVDIKNLTLDGARAIYLADYWRPIRGDELPISLALLVFDSAVNNGVGQAIRWLQRAADVPIDGVLGPRTIAAACAPGVEARFHLTRALAMTEMSGWPTFGKGWAIRLATLPFQALALDSLPGG